MFVYTMLQQGFFSKFLIGGDSKFSVPGRSWMGEGGNCEKNPAEAKTAHLIFCYFKLEIQLFVSPELSSVRDFVITHSVRSM